MTSGYLCGWCILVSGLTLGWWVLFEVGVLWLLFMYAHCYFAAGWLWYIGVDSVAFRFPVGLWVCYGVMVWFGWVCLVIWILFIVLYVIGCVVASCICSLRVCRLVVIGG